MAVPEVQLEVLLGAIKCNKCNELQRIGGVKHEDGPSSAKASEAKGWRMEDGVAYRSGVPQGSGGTGGGLRL